jgi:hypothetical protein
MEQIADQVAERGQVPIIGIGASPRCDGQVLVTEDMLGLFERTPRFVKRYADMASEIGEAVGKYARRCAAVPSRPRSRPTGRRNRNGRAKPIDHRHARGADVPAPDRRGAERGWLGSENRVTYPANTMIARPGEVGPGLLLMMSGSAEVLQQGQQPAHIVTHERGNFMGELAQLSGRPSLVEVRALEDVEAVAVAPDRLRAMLIAEAELGERIMRALILRRMGLIEAGRGPDHRWP